MLIDVFFCIDRRPVHVTLDDDADAQRRELGAHGLAHRRGVRVRLGEDEGRLHLLVSFGSRRGGCAIRLRWHADGMKEEHHCKGFFGVLRAVTFVGECS